jgi:hypothetical protein
LGKDGVPTLMTKDQTADGRAIALRLAEDGTVLEKRSEIPSEGVPPDVQAIFNQSFAGFTIGRATETRSAGVASYELSGKGPNAGVEIVVRADGTVMGYSAKFRPPESQP